MWMCANVAGRLLAWDLVAPWCPADSAGVKVRPFAFDTREGVTGYSEVCRIEPSAPRVHCGPIVSLFKDCPNRGHDMAAKPLPAISLHGRYERTTPPNGTELPGECRCGINTREGTTGCNGSRRPERPSRLWCPRGSACPDETDLGHQVVGSRVAWIAGRDRPGTPGCRITRGLDRRTRPAWDTKWSRVTKWSNLRQKTRDLLLLAGRCIQIQNGDWSGSPSGRRGGS